MFDPSSPLLADFDMAAAMSELRDRWRAEAGLGPDQPPVDRLAASFEAGALHLAEVRSAQAAVGVQEARRARSVAAFCASRPASLDRPDGEVGAAAAASRAARPAALVPVSEWAVDEVAVALSLTEAAASRLVAQSLDLVHRLPGTLAALERGRLTWDHARAMCEVVAPLSDGVRAEAERRLLDRLGSKTPSQLRAAAHRVVQRLDAEAVTRRVEAALRRRRVTVHPTGDGLGTLSLTDLPLPVLRAVEEALRQYGNAAAVPGDDRTPTERMADCLVDLVLRPGEHGLAPVQVQLTLVATIATMLGGDEPGEVAGDLVPAAVVRRLAQALGLLPADPAPADSAPDHPPAPEPADAGSTDTAPEMSSVPEPAGAAPAGSAPDHPPAPEPADGAGTPGPSPDPADADTPRTDERAADPVASGLTALLGTRRVTGTALAHRPSIALTDELTGQLLALTDGSELCGAARAGRGLGPPPETAGYSPSAPLDRFVRLRDRRCRFPGCRKRPIRCDLDHTVPYPRGATSHDNLCCLCRHHHRLSHQAPGWSLRGLPDGGLEWTTPTGQVLVTHPPRFGADDDLPPPDVPGPATDRPPGAAEDPPPF